jgi:hypothetical protein
MTADINEFDRRAQSFELAGSSDFFHEARKKRRWHERDRVR